MDDSFEVSVPYELPTDNDGFARRQCSSCGRQFKWHVGPVSDEAEEHPDADVYYCPFCGLPAESGDWFTPEQEESVEALAHRAMMPKLDEMMGSFLDGLKSSFIKVERTGHLDIPDGPDPLVEPDDMGIVASPCHAYEPIKIPEDWTEPVHCLVCGARFAV